MLNRQYNILYTTMYFISLLLIAPLYVVSQCSTVTINSSNDVSSVKSCTKMGSLSISGDMKQVILDNLQQVESDIKISGTATLTTVSLASLQSAQDIEIANNSGLVTVSLPSISKLTGKLFISGNSPSLEVDVSKLSGVGDSVTFSNCSSIDVSSLSSIGSMASFTGNSFTKLNLTNLKSVNKDLSFSGNDRISTLMLPKLDSVGGTVLIANNTNLESVTFPSLTTIGGSLEVSGRLNKLVFDTLNEIRGSATITSDSSSHFKCTDVEAVHTVTQGKFSCDNGKPNKSSTSKSTKSTGTASNAVVVFLSPIFTMLVITITLFI